MLGQFNALHAAWHPDGRRISVWGTIGKDDVRFLTMPLEVGNATTPEMSAGVQKDLASVSAWTVRLGDFASVHLLRGTGGRYAEHLARYR